MADRFQHRRDTKARWTEINPVLLQGEVGYELDSDQYKLGDGIHKWNELPYRGDPCLQKTGNSKTSSMSQDAITKALDLRTPKHSFLNISQEVNNYQFTDSKTARSAVPTELRGLGQMLVYRAKVAGTSTYCWFKEVFEGTNIDQWGTNSQWRAVEANYVLNISEVIEKYDFESKSEARLAVPYHLREINQILVYRTKEKIVIEYSIVEDIYNDDAWKADSNWKAVGSGGALNVSEEKKNYAFETSLDARNAVQSSDRTLGQLIIYKLASKNWVFEIFAGDSVSSWENNTDWRQVANNVDISNLNNAITDAVKTLSDKIAGKADSCYINSENKLQLTSEGKDIGNAIELTSGIINLTYKDNVSYSTPLDARKKVKTSDRILGQIITYKLSDGTWVLDQFVGESTGSWDSDGSWVQFALIGDLSPLLSDLESIKAQLTLLNANIKGKIDGGYTEDNILYLTSNGEIVGDPIVLPEGGGGTGPSGIVMRVRAVGGTSLVVGDGTDAVIKYNFTSIDQETGDDTGDGTVLITVNGIPAFSGNIHQGDNQYNVKDHLNLGANIVRVRVTDGYENVRSITFNVQKATLVITSTFADDIIYKTSPVAFRYTPIGSGEKKIRFWLNNIEIEPETITASGKQLTKNLTGLVSGANSVRVVAESSIEGSQLVSNELYYEFIYADAGVTKPVITISYKKLEVTQFEIIELPYLVYDPSSTTTTVELVINDVVKQSLTVPRSRQHWSYAAYEQGTVKMEIRCKGITKSVNINVVASEYDITEEKGDLRYKASAIGKSNYSNDRASWAFGDYDAIFKNFLWGEDGWQKDENNDNHLRLIGDSSVEIGIKPFSSAVLLNGLTLTIEYATMNVTDASAEVVSCMLGGVGISLTPSSVQISSAQSTLSARLDSSSKTSISFVVQKLAENRLVYLYIDGVMSGSLQYPTTDNFSQSTPQGLKLTSGNKSCTAMIYTVRWYENNLNYDQIFGNYIFDIEDFDEKIKKYDFNNVIDDYGSIDYNKALNYLPCLTFVGELPTFKGDKKTCDIIYEDRQNPYNSFTATNVQNDVQGTSSQYYPRKNFKFKLQNGLTLSETGQQLDAYQMQGNKIPANVFCTKADFAESSGTHNTGMAVLIDESLRKLNYKVKPQSIDDRVRTTVYGYPILIFHKESAASNTEFIGKYNFNDDKSSVQVFGFTEGCESWEFLNNTSDRCLFKSADLTGTDWLNDFEGRYPDGNQDATNLSKILQWIVSCKGNPSKFKAECAQHFNVDWLLFYCLTTEIFGMVDQRAKNQMLTTYGERGATGELLWYFIFYDNDTVLGVNNEGQIAFDYNVETKDPHGDGHVWNGWNSELWTLVETAYKTELRALYQKIRQQQVLSTSVTLEVLENRQSDKWCEAVYNRDGFFKYIDPLLSAGNGAYLYALQGSRTRHRVWWTKNRFMYLDSKYAAGDYLKDYATMRLYTPQIWGGVAPNADFNIGITKAGYVQIKYGSYITDSIRGYAGQTYNVKAPSIQFNDTETIVYGISAVKSLGDLSAKYPGTVDITNALALEELIIGSLVKDYKNSNLTVLHTGSNEMLKKVNVANCPNLKQSLELTKCYSLEEVEARGSGITGLALPSSGILKTLNLPATFTALYIKNQPYLKTLTLEGYLNLNTIVIENVPSINGYELVKQCVNSDGNKLGKVRLININATDTSAKVMIALLGMTGEDDNGNPTNVAVVTGKIHIDSISQATLTRINENMPELKVTYGVLLNVIDFEDDIVKAIAVANYDTNKDGEISTDEVQFANFPANRLSGTGAKKFNELRYWGGMGSLINDVDTLEEVSIQAGKVELNNLPVLKKLSVYSTNEALDTSPKFGYNTVQNCYSIEQFILSGRYSETAQKGLIIAKQIMNNITFYRFILPLRGYNRVVVSEPLYSRTADGNENTYSWAKDLQSLTLASVYDVQLPFMPSLETVIVSGISPNTNNSLYIDDHLPTLQNLIIDDTSGNNLTLLRLSGGIRNIEIKNLTCRPVTGSYLRIQGCHRMYERIDLPATYQPADIRFANVNTAGQAVSASPPWAVGAKLIIRSPNMIPCAELTNHWSAITGHNWNIYVPDGLVSSYKSAANWNQLASKILPISNLG